MFHPVGVQPPSVYWRRRIVLLGFVVLLVVLLALTVDALSGNGTTPVGSGDSSAAPSTSSKAVATKTSPSSSARPSSSTKSSPPRRGSPSSAPPAACKASALAVAAVAGKSSYGVGDEPMVELQVTNTGSGACVQDLADRQVELRVYNGESRVWGSHDCEVKQGTVLRALAVRQPVRVTVKWSGLTSSPGCKGTRQRVGAGTYTLYAVLSGKTGKATQFSIG